MATTHDPTVESERRDTLIFGAGPKRLRWTVDQYYRLAELGFLRNRRVELISGDIIVMSPANPPHAIGIELLTVGLFTLFGRGYRVRIQLPLDLGRRNQPEPDGAVLLGNSHEARDHPSTALLVVEVSDTSLRWDRTIKANLYARAGIADYWIINLNDRQVEVHRKPGPDPGRKGRFRYAEMTIIPSNGSVTPLAKPDAVISVADLLP